MEKIARLYKVSIVAVLKWVRAAALEVKPLNAVSEYDIVMIDEVWHFVNGKKTKYGSGEPLMGYHVDLLDGTGPSWRCRAKKLISRVDTGTCSFVTDEWGGFFRLLLEERHFYGKDLTFSIEGTNSEIRHRLAHFHRRSKVSSRSL